jgi:hypothetical protein
MRKLLATLAALATVAGFVAGTMTASIPDSPATTVASQRWLYDLSPYVEGRKDELIPA